MYNPVWAFPTLRLFSVSDLLSSINKICLLKCRTALREFTSQIQNNLKCQIRRAGSNGYRKHLFPAKFLLLAELWLFILNQNNNKNNDNSNQTKNPIVILICGFGQKCYLIHVCWNTELSFPELICEIWSLCSISWWGSSDVQKQYIMPRLRNFFFLFSVTICT